jgi:hypothetical protein
MSNINIKDMNDSENNTKNNKSSESINKNYNIYRYKFSENVINELSIFSKIHQYDDKNTFKESWEEWVSNNLDMINREQTRLSELGYTGCVKTKMYKSCRYYFSKKKDNKEDQTERRKKYIMLNINVLNSMDKHIIQNMNTDNYKPANGYEEYCLQNIELLKEDILEMVGLSMNTEEIKLKIKKTYKNRYFIISRNITKYNKIYEDDENNNKNDYNEN